MRIVMRRRLLHRLRWGGRRLYRHGTSRLFALLAWWWLSAFRYGVDQAVIYHQVMVVDPHHLDRQSYPLTFRDYYGLMPGLPSLLRSGRNNLEGYCHSIAQFTRIEGERYGNAFSSSR